MIVGIIATCLLVAAGILLYRYSAFFTWQLYKFSVKRLKDVPYTEDNDPRHTLDVYLPKNSRSFPIVHFVYGGYWISGDKRYRQWLTGLYGNIGVALARHGIGVVVSNYRLGPKVDINGQTSDTATSIGWTAANAKQWGWDGRLYVMGHSAGAHIISLLASNPNLYQQYTDFKVVKGYIALSPVLDIEALVKSHDASFNRKISYPVFGNSAKDWHKYSPLDHFLAKPDKSLKLSLVVGERDFEHIRTNVPDGYKKLQKAGVPATLTNIPGYSHTALVTRFGQRQDPVIRLVLDFVND